MFLDMNPRKYSLITCMQLPAPNLAILPSLLVANIWVVGKMDYSPTSPGSTHLGVRKLGRRAWFGLMKKCSQRGWYNTHLGDEGLGCSCLGEDTYLTWL